MRTLRRRIMLRPKFKDIEFVYNNGAYIDTELPEGDYIFKVKCATLPETPWVLTFIKSQRATGNTDRYYSSISNDNGNSDKSKKLIAQGCGSTFDNINMTIYNFIPTDANIFEFRLGLEPGTYWHKCNGKYIIAPKQGHKEYFKDKTVKLFFDTKELHFGKIYFFQIFTSEGTLIRDYIPVVKASNGKAGLLEKVQNKFYNKGTNGIEFTTIKLKIEEDG